MGLFADDRRAEQTGSRVGSDLLLTTQVAKQEHVHPRTVQRWIEKGLPAEKATHEQLGDLVACGLLSSIPPHPVYLIRKTDLKLIPKIRAYPKETTRPRRGKKTGAGEVERK
jgi:hypothetical protein